MRLPQYTLRNRLSGILAALSICLVACISIAEEALNGEQIFRDQCARCHGDHGQGTEDNYPEFLIGDKSIAQLTAVIHETMPEDVDTKCSPEEAAKVAAYIYDAFYSADAQVRNKPARVELSRLTVRQYQNAVTDLIGSFRKPSEWGRKRGLRGEYNQSRYIGNDKKTHFERTDPEVNFTFGEASPDPEKLEAAEYSIRWRGSILAPDTGDYEFVVRTEHATRLFVNDMDEALIDAWVKSSGEVEHRATIRLLGGRVYPIRLDFSKAQQGVGDAEKSKYKSPASAFITLAWKRPNHTDEIIPSRSLSPKQAPTIFVLRAPFPPDDRSIGYERGTSVSKAWDEATTEAAIEVAGYVTSHLEELSGTSADKAAGEPMLREFCLRFAERAFRRPLTDEQKELYVNRQFAESPDRLTAVKRSLLLVLKSPRFLYRELGEREGDGHALASRISFGLWDSLPDEELIKAAAEGQLANREQVDRQINRMLPDLRTRAKLREFLLNWLKISQPRDLSKDPKAYPDFTAEIASDLRTSLELSIDEMASSESADFRQFLLSDAMFLNGRLAKIYDADLPTDAPFQKVAFQPEYRAGVLSHPYLLARLAYTTTSSPIHRGVFLTRSVMGRVLRPPAESVAPLAVEAHADLTTRQRVALQTEPEACQSCHSMINPLGFTLENFDAIGRYRESEQDKPIDATGSYLKPDGRVAAFKGMKDLANFVATSDEAQQAFVKQMFHHTVKQPIRAYGPDRLQAIQQDFAKREFSIQKLLAEIVATSAVAPR